MSSSMLSSQTTSAARKVMLEFPESPPITGSLNCGSFLFNLRPTISVSLTLCHGSVRTTHADRLIHHPTGDNGPDD